MLLVRAEVPELADDGGAQVLTREVPIAAQGVDQAVFAEFFACGIERFGDPVGVQDKRVARTELAIGERAFPFSACVFSAGIFSSS